MREFLCENFTQRMVILPKGIVEKLPYVGGINIDMQCGQKAETSFKGFFNNLVKKKKRES